MTVHVITLTDGQDAPLAIEVRIADEHDERTAGYQYICPEAVDDSAILFVFRKPLTGRFHMRNVYVPLDIAFFDATGEMIDAATMRPEPPGFPSEPRYYGSRLPYLYALETPAGFLKEHGLSQGRAHLLIGSLP